MSVSRQTPAIRFLYSWIIIFIVFSIAACARSDWPPECKKNEPLTVALANLDFQRWMSWVRILSGAEPVSFDGEQTLFTTRYTPSLFSGANNARAYAWLKEQLLLSFPESYLEEHEYRDNYLCVTSSCTGWRNLTLTVPGHDLAGEEVLITAHLDSISANNAEQLAPGADDNASGAATLIELATILPKLQLRRTIKLVWFSGEEQGLTGSVAWVSDHDLDNIRGVINVDSIAWDGNSDKRMEIHAGSDKNSQALAACVLALIPEYQPDLVPELLSGSHSAGNSDHSSFWHRGVGAIMLSEDLCADSGCENPSGDLSVLHHTDQDTVNSFAANYAFDIAGAAIAAVLSLAELR